MAQVALINGVPTSSLLRLRMDRMARRKKLLRRAPTGTRSFTRAPAAPGAAPGLPWLAPGHAPGPAPDDLVKIAATFTVVDVLAHIAAFRRAVIPFMEDSDEADEFVEEATEIYARLVAAVKSGQIRPDAILGATRLDNEEILDIWAEGREEARRLAGIDPKLTPLPADYDEARAAIAVTTSEAPVTDGESSVRWRKRLPWIVGGALALAVVGGVVVATRR